MKHSVIMNFFQTKRSVKSIKLPNDNGKVQPFESMSLLYEKDGVVFHCHDFFFSGGVVLRFKVSKDFKDFRVTKLDGKFIGALRKERVTWKIFSLAQRLTVWGTNMC